MNRFATPALVGFVLSLLGFGSAFAVNSGLAMMIAIPNDAELRAPGAVPRMGDAATTAGALAARREARRSTSQYVEGILCRNIFDPEAIVNCKPAAAGGAGASGDVRTDLKIKLIATAVAVPEVYSSALIVEDAPNAVARGYFVGDEIFGAEIISIDWDKIVLRKADGKEEVLDIEKEAVTTSSRSSRSSGSDDEGIEALGGNKFAIERSLIDKFASDPSSLSTMGRALLHRGPDGGYDGYRLSAVRRGTPPDKLGIKNGDIIHSINGLPLNSMQGAMKAYTSLQGESELTIELTRRGKRQTMEYEVR